MQKATEQGSNCPGFGHPLSVEEVVYHLNTGVWFNITPAYLLYACLGSQIPMLMWLGLYATGSDKWPATFTFWVIPLYLSTVNQVMADVGRYVWREWVQRGNDNWWREGTERAQHRRWWGGEGKEEREEDEEGDEGEEEEEEEVDGEVKERGPSTSTPAVWWKSKTWSIHVEPFEEPVGPTFPISPSPAEVFGHFSLQPSVTT